MEPPPVIEPLIQPLIQPVIQALTRPIPALEESPRIDRPEGPTIAKQEKLALVSQEMYTILSGIEPTNVELLQANGTAERDVALLMIEAIPGDHRVTLAGDKGYDTKDFVAETRQMNATPHVAQNNKNRKSAIDGRTTRHPGYQISQQRRKRVEEIFGWMKTVGGMRKLRHRGLEVVAWTFTMAAAAYNLVRIRNLSSKVFVGGTV